MMLYTEAEQVQHHAHSVGAYVLALRLCLLLLQLLLLVLTARARPCSLPSPCTLYHTISPHQPAHYASWSALHRGFKSLLVLFPKNLFCNQVTFCSIQTCQFQISQTKLLICCKLTRNIRVMLPGCVGAALLLPSFKNSLPHRISQRQLASHIRQLYPSLTIVCKLTCGLSCTTWFVLNSLM